MAALLNVMAMKASSRRMTEHCLSILSGTCRKNSHKSNQDEKNHLSFPINKPWTGSHLSY